MRRLNSLLCESPWPGRVRIECAGRDLLGEERAHLLAQRLAFGRQADLIEVSAAVAIVSVHQRAATSGQNSSAPRAAIRLPSAAAQWLSLPKSSRQASRRSV